MPTQTLAVAIERGERELATEIVNDEANRWTDAERDVATDSLIQALHFEPAIYLLRLAVAGEPGNSERLFNLAALLRMTGAVDEALDLCVRAISANPRLVRAHHLLADLADPQLLVANIGMMLDLLNSNIPNTEKSHLHYAIAQSLDKIGDYQRAFEHVGAGAQLLSGRYRYDVEHDIRTIDSIIGTQTRRSLPPRAACNLQYEPIFVCGLPRSGTTLVEQIILRSGKCTSVGESPAFSLAAQYGLRDEFEPSSQLSRHDVIARLRALDMPKLGGRYITNLRSQTGGAARFVDKALLNYLSVGIITRALPSARVIAVQRNARDSLASIFKTYFSGLYPWALDPIDLARYIVAQRRLIAHWRDVISPAQFLCLNYERLATDPVNTGRSLFNFLQMEWRADVLDPKILHPAVSASAVQIRKPVTTASIGSWENYRPWFGKALALLDA